MKQITLQQDKDNPSDWRVESILEDGAIEVAIFSGPNACQRAKQFRALLDILG